MVVKLPATIPSQMGLELPVNVVTALPVRWKDRTMLFTPAKDFAECTRLEVANVIVTGSQTELNVRVTNFSKKPVTVEAGFVIGSLTPMRRDVRFSALHVAADEPTGSQASKLNETNSEVRTESPLERAIVEPLPAVRVDVMCADQKVFNDYHEDEQSETVETCDGVRRDVRSVVLKDQGLDCA